MLHFAPDSTVHDPNTFSSITNLVPVRDGSWKSPFTQEATWYPTLATFTPYDCFLGVRDSGSSRLYVASDTVIKEADGLGTGWTTRGTFTSSPNGWGFCQTGDFTIAASLTNTIQKATATGSFTTLIGTLKAQCVAPLEGALAFWNVVDNGTSAPAKLVISDIGDITNVTPATDLATLAYKATLTDTPGAGTALCAYRDMLCIFKRRGFWVAQYVGAPLIWDVRLVSQSVGCFTKDSWCVAGDKLYFHDDNDIYEFDGAQIRSIGQNVRRYLLTGDFYLATGMHMAYDDVNNLVKFYCGGGPGLAATAIWNYCPDTQEWGHQGIIGASGTAYIPLRCAKQEIRDFIGGFSAVNENAPMFGKTGTSMFFQNGLTPTAGTTAVTTLFGDPWQASEVSRVFADATGGTATVTVDAYRGATTAVSSESTSTSATIVAGVGDVKAHGHWFRLTFSGTGITSWKNFNVLPIQRGRN